MTIWGNHSATQYPDLFHAEVGGRNAAEVVDDQDWIENTFIPTVAKRGAAIIEARGSSSAASAASATIDAAHDWLFGSADDDWVSMAVALRRLLRRPRGTRLVVPGRHQGRRLDDRPGARDRRLLARPDRRLDRRARRGARRGQGARADLSRPTKADGSDRWWSSSAFGRACSDETARAEASAAELGTEARGSSSRSAQPGWLGIVVARKNSAAPTPPRSTTSKSRLPYGEHARVAAREHQPQQRRRSRAPPARQRMPSRQSPRPHDRDADRAARPARAGRTRRRSSTGSGAPPRAPARPPRRPRRAPRRSPPGRAPAGRPAARRAARRSPTVTRRPARPSARCW